MTPQQAALIISCAGLTITVLGWFLQRLWALQDKQFHHIDVRLDKIDRRLDHIEFYAAKAAQISHPSSIAAGIEQ